jgi:hypothetical protein
LSKKCQFEPQNLYLKNPKSKRNLIYSFYGSTGEQIKLNLLPDMKAYLLEERREEVLFDLDPELRLDRELELRPELLMLDERPVENEGRLEEEFPEYSDLLPLLSTVLLPYLVLSFLIDGRVPLCPLVLFSLLLCTDLAVL